MTVYGYAYYRYIPIMILLISKQSVTTQVDRLKAEDCQGKGLIKCGVTSKASWSKAKIPLKAGQRETSNEYREPSSSSAAYFVFFHEII